MDELRIIDYLIAGMIVIILGEIVGYLAVTNAEYSTGFFFCLAHLGKGLDVGIVLYIGIVGFIISFLSTIKRDHLADYFKYDCNEQNKNNIKLE